VLIYVTDLDGNTEPLNNYQRLEINEEINGIFTVSVTSFQNENNPGHNLLGEESIVHINGYDFRVKQAKEYNNVKECTAISTFYDLVNKRQNTIYGGTRTIDQFATHIFQDTGWTFTNRDVTKSALIPNFGVDNVIKLNQIMCDAFECEFEILPNKQVVFANQIGGNYDTQYRFGHNIQALSKSVDTTNMRTRITAHGDNNLSITYTSPNAETYGILVAEPFEDTKLSTEASLLIRAKQELQDYPLTTIELNSVEMTDKELGERVWLIYEPLNIEYQTRIMSKKTVVRNGNLVTESVTIGNTIPRTITDILTSQRVDIDKYSKETRSRFEQTDDKITLAVEQFTGDVATAYSMIELTAEAIRSEVAAEGVRLDGLITDAKSTITQTASAIRVEITKSSTASREYMDDQKTLIDARIDTDIGTINGLIDGVEGQIGVVDGRVDALGNEIGVVVDSIGIYDTELATLKGEIVEIKSTATSQFDILSDAVTAGVTESKTYTDDLGNAVRGEASASFQVLSSSISAKAENSVVSALGVRVTTAQTSLDAAMGLISSKVSLSDITGEIIWSRIDQTASSVKIKAKNIELIGITEVANTLHIGGHHTDWSTKHLKFNGDTGYGGLLYKPSGDSLEVYALNDLILTSTYVNIHGEMVIRDGIYNRSAGLNIRTGGQYSGQEIRLITPTTMLRVHNTNSGVYVRDGVDSFYKPVYASAFTISSRRDVKKDIVVFDRTTNDKTAIEAVMSTPVYNYRYKDELPTELKRLGFIYEESPVEGVDLTGEGVDVYGMLALLWKAVQEQQVTIKQIKGGNC